MRKMTKKPVFSYAKFVLEHGHSDALDRTRRFIEEEEQERKRNAANTK